MIVHVLIIVIVALIPLSADVQQSNVMSMSKTGDMAEELEAFQIEPLNTDSFEEVEAVSEPMVETAEPIEEMEQVDLETPLEMNAAPISVADMVSEMAPPSDLMQTLSSMNDNDLGSRSEDMKKQMLRKYGGTESSEAAVTKALKWLERHQMPNGGWTFAHQAVCREPVCDHNGSKVQDFSGATALALLPFLGAGQTHLTGQYKETVRRGLLFLISQGKPTNAGGMSALDFTKPGGNMYSHGIAAIVLCEAYAMTEDPSLAAPAQGALNFIMAAQGPRGGWRYKPGQEGDTSAVGWQVMALKSGHMAHLTVHPAVIRGSNYFLEFVQSDGGSMYGYTGPTTKFRPGTTAVGLLCRMYLGWGKNHPGIEKGVQHLLKHGVSKNDVYYNYYAVQVLRHYGGSEWETFNSQMRDFLVSTQVESGPAGGSWIIGGEGHANHAGGRLYMTAMATMILEVYYRHMPLYNDTSAEDEFPL
ncbi:MAG: prenyltransferase/squalene oxidase repeat-containing protein [Pirellulaceae bacterium]